MADEPTGNLDSQTGTEILCLFQQLNRQGITIIFVTHDPEIAAYSRRVIQIRDGLIEKDVAMDSLVLECGSSENRIAALYRQLTHSGTESS
jgi:putative ABC transport system ATP-binding protein